jgi:hypothetical protein
MKSAHASPLRHAHNVGIMPPHCDSLDGPVVTAARRALDAGNVDVVLPFVPEQGEAAVKDVFQRTLRVRALDDEAREVADRLFFETVVRVHRAGEGAPYTGLKPAGLSFGPVIPLAETAVETGTAEPVSDAHPVTLEVLPCEIRHAGRQRNDEQLDGARSLVGSTIRERLVDSHFVAAHGRDVLRTRGVLHHDCVHRPVLRARLQRATSRSTCASHC